MRRVLLMFLTVCLIVSVCPLGVCTVTASALTNGTTGDCTWSLDGTVLTISGDGNMGDYTFGEWAPWGTLITALIIKDGVKNIGNYAFYGSTSLTNVIISSSVTNIGAYSFYYCNSLTEVFIPNSVKSVGACAFSSCHSLTNVTLSENITILSGEVFRTCKSIDSITVPDGVTHIEGFVFDGCSNLTNITLPNSITSIERDAFNGCTNLQNVWYKGSEKEVSEMEISNRENAPLFSATWHYNSCPKGQEHKFTHYDKVVPTCKNDGKIEYWHCEKCYGLFSDSEGANTIDEANLLIAKDKNNHIGQTYISGYKESKCEEPGYTGDTCCKDCGIKIENGKTILGKGHKMCSWSQTKAPGCTTKGIEQRKCTVSGCSHTETRDLAATGHDMGSWSATKEATCEAKGEQTRSCSKCSHKETKAINALGHKFSNSTVTKEPTCTETGIESGKCTRCNKETTNAIKVTGHKMGESVVILEPTCTAEGQKEGTCTVCGKKAQEKVAAKGHTFGEAVVTKEATETETGIKTATCTACGETKEEEIPYITTEPETPTEDEKTDSPVSDDDKNKDSGNNTLWIVIAIGAVVFICGGVTAVMLIKKKKANIV